MNLAFPSSPSLSSHLFSIRKRLQDTIARRDPPKPISQDVAQMSQHRCNVQALVDAMVNAVMRGAAHH